MFAIPTRSMLRALCDTEGPWVTLVTPLGGGGPDAKADPIRYRNLVREAAEQLASRGESSGDAIVDRLDELGGARATFASGARAMCVYASAGALHRWYLPEPVDARVVVDDRPYLEPLLPFLSRSIHFYVVALSLHSTRLFSCDGHEARPLPLPDDAPDRLEDAAGWQTEEQHLQYHDIQPGRGGPAGNEGNAPIYHGHGGGEDDRDVDIDKYLRAIDDALWKAIPHRDEPVVIACSPNVEGRFRMLTRLPNVVSPAVHGNFDRATPEDVHERALRVVEPLFEARVDDARQRFLDLHGTGRTAVRIEDVVPLACEGRVETLLVREGASREGRFDEERWKVRLESPEPPTTDLVDRAVTDTFLRHGAVHFLPPEAMPMDADTAAILRW